MRSPVGDALAALEGLLRALGIEGYLFGAQAAILHGSPRTTADIDMTAELGAVPLTRLLSEAHARGFIVRVV